MLVQKQLNLNLELNRKRKEKVANIRKSMEMIRKHKITIAIDIPSIKEELKQEIQVKAQRERGLDKRNKLYS